MAVNSNIAAKKAIKTTGRHSPKGHSPLLGKNEAGRPTTPSLQSDSICRGSHFSVTAEESRICKYRRSLNIHPSIHPFSITASRALAFARRLSRLPAARQATVWTGRHNTTHTHNNTHTIQSCQLSGRLCLWTTQDTTLSFALKVVTAAVQDVEV